MSTQLIIFYEFFLIFFDLFAVFYQRQCVCIAGDNVAQNKCLADELGVDYAKCIAHALGLLMTHFLGGLQLILDVLLNLSAVIGAGGTMKRKAQLAEEGIKAALVQKIICKILKLLFKFLILTSNPVPSFFLLCHYAN